MDYSRNIINERSNIYLNYDYLMFPVNLNIVPKIAVGSKSFISKICYHVSLLCLEGISEKDQTKILNFAQKYDLKINKVLGEFRLVTEKDQQTIIVRVRFFGLKKLISEINKEFGYHFVYPPTHITLFTLKGQTGIGVDTFKIYRQISSPLISIDIKQLVKSFKLI